MECSSDRCSVVGPYRDEKPPREVAILIEFGVPANFESIRSPGVVSRLEHRDDMLLSTLYDHLTATGAEGAGIVGSSMATG